MTYTIRLSTVDRWLQGLLTWTSGQTDIIKTVALVLMVIDHTGLMLAGNNEMMRLIGRGCFPLFGIVWGSNLANKGEIRQSQLNSLWCWAIIAQCSFVLLGYPWYMGNILFTFVVAGQALRWLGLHTRNDNWLAIALVITWLPLSECSYGGAGVAMLISSYRLFHANGSVERVGYATLWAIMVLMLNINNIEQSLAGLSISILVLAVCSGTGSTVSRFWPRHFFAMFYAVHLAALGVIA